MSFETASEFFIKRSPALTLIHILTLEEDRSMIVPVLSHLSVLMSPLSTSVLFDCSLHFADVIEK
uniref:Uncharacterized protein n=1 Tax=Moniliophthora roreri TaxID=221103 RepID=A0A0W0FPT6_MONRR